MTEVAAVEPQQKSHPVWLGGASAMMAVCITHPIDQTKIRSQTQAVRRGMIETARNTVRGGGVIRLWDGLSGSLLRQATYSMARFGVYNYLKDRDRRAGRPKSRMRLVGNGAVAGLIAGLIGSPAELVMVRMSADGVKPPEKRFRYKNALDGLIRIAREEGLSSTFRGWGAASLRSVIMNGSQLSCYDMIKEALFKTGYFSDNVPLHLLTAVLGGTIAVTAVAPVDVMKSRIQFSSSPGTSAMSIVSTSLKQEGFSVLFRGWLPAWLRMAPTTMLTFAFFEQMKRVF
ncbi:dicarboxylic acid transporter [Naematelia encephala]|uniref:Dicarboxylic acid transporter n=1 Tax=Naematelia encephala TaxID=71784 RepID=A0A1Y2B5W2_9TREE|nr:dicarboxylic acid transporter [Naematelia encephala]